MKKAKLSSFLLLLLSFLLIGISLTAPAAVKASSGKRGFALA